MKNYFTILFSILSLFSVKAQNNKFNLIVGTYTKNCDSKGIYVYEFDSETGNFKLKNNTENSVNPNFLSLSSDNKFLYSVNDISKNASAAAFKFDSKSGKLDLLNHQAIQSESPCYIINDDKNVIVANYTGGSITVFKKNQDGSITEAKQLIQHSGKGFDARRQSKPYAHMVYFTPDKKYVLATDLGTDKVYIYQYNPNSVDEILKFKSSISVNPGGGPRHLTFSKDGKYVYLLQELDGKIVVYSYANGELSKVSEATTIAKDFVGSIGAADIHVSPDEKFLYATNRGSANDISSFKIVKKGKLEFIERKSTLGNQPRSFAIDPSGNFLVVAHQYSNDILIFKRDIKTGMLTATGNKIELCSPVCVIFTKI